MYSLQQQSHYTPEKLLLRNFMNEECHSLLKNVVHKISFREVAKELLFLLSGSGSNDDIASVAERVEFDVSLYEC